MDRGGILSGQTTPPRRFPAVIHRLDAKAGERFPFKNFLVRPLPVGDKG